MMRISLVIISTELFSCTNNKLTELPDIFNAKSKYVIKAIDFSYNEISKLENGDIVPWCQFGRTYFGIQ